MLTLLVGAGGRVREKLRKPRWRGRASEGCPGLGDLAGTVGTRQGEPTAPS